MRTNVLLTGASGFLGKQILQTLASQYDFVTVGRSGMKVSAGRHIQLDLSKEETDKFPSVDVVIHCAGKAHMVPRTSEEKEEFYKVNLKGTQHLCKSLIASGAVPSSLVFISTVAVYGVDAGENIAEEHPLSGKTPYAESKILAEQYLEKWAAENDVKLLILRLPLIAGPHPPGNLGAMIRGIRSARYLSIGRAAARKSIVWAQDVAALIPHAINIGGIYNLTDGQHPSFRELETCIANTLNKKQPPAIPMLFAKVMGGIGDLLGQRAPVNSDKLRKITSTLTFDDTKARELLNWRPSPVIEKLSSVL